MQKIHNKVLKDTMFYHDIPVLTYKINYPFLKLHAVRRQPAI